MIRLRHHLFLVKELAKRDFQSRYAGSVLSVLWSFIQPLWQLLLFTFVFSLVMKIPIERFDVGTGSFGIFLFCGLMPWMAVQEGVARGSSALTDNANLVKKLRFPSEVLIVAVVFAALLHEAIAMMVFLVVLATVGDLSVAGLPWLLVALPAQLFLTLGLAMILSGIHVFFRDIGQILGMALTGWFYLTPIVYPLGLVPESFRIWVELNPLTILVGLYRRAFLGRGDTDGVAMLAVLSVVVLLVGAAVFRKLRSTFVDEL